MVKIAEHLLEATFIERENRFVGLIEINGKREKTHIMNPGRMVKFLIPGAKVLVEDRSSPHRKLKYSLLYVILPHTLILIDSQIPNKIVYEALLQKKISYFQTVRLIEPEQRYGKEMHSRIDFLLDNHIYIEVKATNYVQETIGYFPDAPTTRGQRHLQELINVKTNNPPAEGYVLFLAQRLDITEIRPFSSIDPKFSKLLNKAQSIGVNLVGYQIEIKEGGKIVELGHEIPVNLNN